jgi:hypothetical protein
MLTMNFHDYIVGLCELGISPLFALLVSLLDLADSVMPPDPEHFSEQVAADRNALLFEPLIFEEPTLHRGWQRTLRPVFDSLWNAYGHARCHAFYDAEGNWRAR